MELPVHVNIKENSWLARLAAIKLGTKRMAMVVRKTIYLYNVSKETFLADEAWVRHELVHVQQFKEHGTFAFLIKYFAEWIKHGYHNNAFEVEARAAEQILKPGVKLKK